MVELFITFAFVTLLSINLAVVYVRSKRGISVTSIKSAIDSMVTGVMFCQFNGFGLLVNEQMQRLMIEITGKTRRNGRLFFDLLTRGEVESGCDATWFEEQNVILLPDDSAWQFSMIELPVGRKKFIQLTATEISEQWKLTSELQRQNDTLLQRQGELHETIANLHILSRERETQRAKMRVHDILGEHLTVLQGAIFGNQEPDYAQLRLLSQGLLDDLKTSGIDPEPQAELQVIKQIFQTVGVEIVISGSLPEDHKKGHLIVDIVREAVNNAVRHGLATQVLISISDSISDSDSASDRGISLEITDNGYPPLLVKEGGGISGMRSKLEPFYGTVDIAVEPQFVLSIIIPGGGGADDQSADR